MPLRINVLEDKDFRKDLLNMARGVLRSVAQDAINETIRAEGWLKRQVENYFAKQPVAELVKAAFKDHVLGPQIRKVIVEEVEAVVARVRPRDDNHTKQLIRDELHNTRLLLAGKS